MQPDQYLTSVITPLLKHPEEFSVSTSTDEMGVLLTISLHKEDMGGIIGKAGETAKAIRLLLRIVGLRNQARVSMRINEPEGSTRGFHQERLTI